ncbi:MAG: CHAD domain-containing protein, partial [Nitrosospira sp.]
ASDDLARPGYGTPVKEFAGILLARRHRQLKKYGKKRMNFSAPELHALRILAKKQRYATEFFAALYPHREAKRYIQSLSALQDILGVMNDATIAEGLLSEVPIARDRSDEHEAVGIIRGWGASMALVKKRELDRVWRRFDKNNPFW